MTLLRHILSSTKYNSYNLAHSNNHVLLEVGP